MEPPEITYSRSHFETEYDRIAVIDGLSEDERHRWQVTDQLTDYFTAERIHWAAATCGNASGLFVALEELTKLADNGEKLMLHFVCHGGRQGIQIGSDIVPWGDFWDHLTTLNRAVAGDLLLNMSSCFGLNAVKVVDERPDLPFFGVIGSKKELYFSKLPQLNQRMYYKWITGTPINEMVDEINDEEFGEEVLFCITAEGYQQIRHDT